MHALVVILFLAEAVRRQRGDPGSRCLPHLLRRGRRRRRGGSQGALGGFGDRVLDRPRAQPSVVLAFSEESSVRWPVARRRQSGRRGRTAPLCWQCSRSRTVRVGTFEASSPSRSRSTSPISPIHRYRSAAMKRSPAASGAVIARISRSTTSRTSTRLKPSRGTPGMPSSRRCTAAGSRRCCRSASGR